MKFASRWNYSQTEKLNSLIGMKCLEDIRSDSKLIIKKGEAINKKKLKELQAIGKETILVRSNEVGELIYLNKRFKKN